MYADRELRVVAGVRAHRAVGLLALVLTMVLGILSGPARAADDAKAADTDAAADKKMAENPDEAHLQVFLKDRFPSATACGDCHPTQYRQWSVSQHAYAQMSPVFNAMHGKILKLTNGTNGDFCVRCHTPVGMNLEEPEFMSNIDRSPTSREGITCIVCHRLNQSYGKLSGRLAIVEGDLTQPIYGPKGNPAELKKTIEKGGLVTDKDKAGRQVHGDVKKFFQLNTSGFCGICHDVTLVNGFRLEEAFSEFKNSPAAKAGISCQDCHMGKEPGRIVADINDPDFDYKNYAHGPAAKVGSLETKPRKLTNHMFVGPDYSVLPPSLFPLNLAAIREESEKDDPAAHGMATIRNWLDFNWRAGWGTDKFENEAPKDYKFPARWESIDDRYDAYEIVVLPNLKLLLEMKKQRLKLLRNGYKLGEIETVKADDGGIKFKVEVRNGTNGHNVPTGFDAERLVWLHTTVTDADGNVVFESGDLDPNGDLRDLHSSYVHNHELPLDDQLFSLQSKFITRNIRGGEREQVLAVNYSPSPLPFLRPETRPTILYGRPAGARKHKMGIEPDGTRIASYSVDGSKLSGKGPYKAVVQLKAGMVPVNLLNEIKDVGFDYNMSARLVADNLVKGYVDKEGKPIIWNPDSKDPEENVVNGHQVVWEREVQFNVHGTAE
ncbi:MAG: hypothetical protein GC159_21230 [Phycisphaera sp.]|nr:hypothetical protein [Phycisphaera sp.]